MKKLLLPIVLISIFLYSLSGWLGILNEQTVTYNMIFMANMICLLCLIIANMYSVFVQVKGKKQVDFEDEDDWRLSLERATYAAISWIQVALSISFVAFLAGFMLLRDSNPKVAFYAIVLFVSSVIALIIGTYLIRFTHPEFKLPNPQSPTYQQELFDSYDDGEKYLMLKGLYKLYFWIIILLALLGIALMFYSIFSGKSQLISIIGIGCILLFVQIYYSMSLKPKKTKVSY